MKILIQVEGDFYEEYDDLIPFLRAKEIASSLINTRNELRRLIKYVDFEEVNPDELKRLLEVVYEETDVECVW